MADTCTKCNQVIQDITDQMIEDIASTAFEGGSTYWIDKLEWDPKISPNASKALLTQNIEVHYGAEEDCKLIKVLSEEDLAGGIRTAAAYAGETVEHFYENHDANSADLAVQFAVLGEIVYG